MNLFDDYKRTHANITTLGRHNFIKVSQILCQKGEIKTGLSSYFVKVRDVSEVLNRMLDRVGSLSNVVGIGFTRGDTEILNDTNYLKELWLKVEQFLQYEYSAHHIVPDSEYKCHCYRFALNKVVLDRDAPCNHDHNLQTCMSCIQPFLLFDKTTTLLQHVATQLQDNSPELVKELNTMIKLCTSIFTPTVKTYMAHRVRAVAQFAQLRKETLGFSEEVCGLWLDHKQKILPQIFREGHVEYFAKRGMSLLGCMLVRRVTRENSAGNQITGLTYNFYEVVINKYSDQDHVQVLGVLDAIIHKIQNDFPKIKHLMLGSDNASCLAYHDAIPYKSG